LRLYMSRTQAGSEPVGLHLALADWGEGASVAPGQEGNGTAAMVNDATWLHTFYPSAFWTSPGGDFDPLASASLPVAGTGFYTWSGATLAADVQTWVNDPTTNLGWFVLGNEAVELSAKRFAGRTASTASRRPQLTIDFTPGSGGGACCLPNGGCVL